MLSAVNCVCSLWNWRSKGKIYRSEELLMVRNETNIKRLCLEYQRRALRNGSNTHLRSHRNKQVYITATLRIDLRLNLVSFPRPSQLSDARTRYTVLWVYPLRWCHRRDHPYTFSIQLTLQIDHVRKAELFRCWRTRSLLQKTPFDYKFPQYGARLLECAIFGSGKAEHA